MTLTVPSRTIWVCQNIDTSATPEKWQVTSPFTNATSETTRVPSTHTPNETAIRHFKQIEPLYIIVACCCLGMCFRAQCFGDRVIFSKLSGVWSQTKRKSSQCAESVLLHRL